MYIFPVENKQRKLTNELLSILIDSVRPILHVGEYSLVALQYRRIRYIGLRVSTDTDTPAAITINSNRYRSKMAYSV